MVRREILRRAFPQCVLLLNQSQFEFYELNVPNGTQGDPAAGNHDYHLKQRGINFNK